jgi:hypothetical protein
MGNVQRSLANYQILDDTAIAFGQAGEPGHEV